jgi:toxin-antitoxin system PIN domain toxin
MTFLADVNVLLALAWSHHPDHGRARRWWSGLARGDALATCAITELGFVRVSVQPAFGAADVAMARKALEQLRAARPGGILLPDSIGAEGLPEWVKSAKQTTDGHLVALAESHGAQLVTFDTGIPGARVI